VLQTLNFEQSNDQHLNLYCIKIVDLVIRFLQIQMMCRKEFIYKRSHFSLVELSKFQRCGYWVLVFHGVSVSLNLLL